MIKRLISIMLTLSILLLAVPVFAGSLVASGGCGKNSIWTSDDREVSNVTWSLWDDGTLFISGNGEMQSYVYVDSFTPSTPPWYEYASSIKTVEVEEGVTNIGGKAFLNSKNLTNVILHESLRSIDFGAFSGCGSLKNLTIPNGVTTIGENAFEFCYALETLDIPASVTSIHEDIFRQSDKALKAINVSENNNHYSSIDGVLFTKAKSTLIKYPCQKDGTEYTIPDGVKIIGNSAFYDCSNLKSVTFSDSVTTIGTEAFDSCSSLTNVKLSKNLESIGFSAFQWTPITNIEIPYGVTTIESFAFANTPLTSVTSPGSVKHLDSQTFNFCNSLKSATISYGVEEISPYMFNYCESLENIVIPATVKSIGKSAFFYCYDLEDIYYGGCEEEWNKININSDGSETGQFAPGSTMFEDFNSVIGSAKIHFGSKLSGAQPIRIFINEKEIETDQTPVLKNDRTLIPVRAVCENLNMDVNWTEETKTVEITEQKTGNKISMVIGAGKAYVNGTEVALDQPPYQDKSTFRTMVPVRFVSEALGYSVNWDEEEQIVSISK